MRRYCKAYTIGTLRQFGGWAELPEPGTALADDAICFIWDDYVVRSGDPFQDGGSIFDSVTPEWRAFCSDVLRFDVPEDLHPGDSNGAS
jgi:hypothetical protein